MSDTQKTVQARLDQATNEKDPVAGCTFGAVDRTGKIIALAASGLEDLSDSSRPAKTDSVYAIYSCTKMIAGIACMQLVEQVSLSRRVHERRTDLLRQGILKLDDPEQVAEHLPEVANAKLVDGSSPKEKITLRMLLTHTAGFGYTFFNPELKAWEKEIGDDEFGE